MPVFLMFTNVPTESIPKNFLKDTTKMISQAIRKPEQYITVRIHPGQMMSHGGSTEPCANSELQAIGNMGVEENKMMSKMISKFLEEHLKIKPDRNYIKFTDFPAMEVGFIGTTFDDIPLPKT